MQNTMIKIERNEKMEKAAARCRNVHPKVRRVDAQTVTVYGSKGNAYTVRFAEPKAGLKLAACNCEAGKKSQLCYHIPAAIVAPVAAGGTVRQRLLPPLTVPPSSIAFRPRGQATRAIKSALA